MRKFRIASVCTALILAMTGCGEDETEQAREEIGQIVQTLSMAARAGNGERICRETFTAELQASVSKAAKTSCGIAVRKSLYSPDAIYKLRDVVIDGDKATAAVIDHKNRSSTLSLVKSDEDDWRIAKID